MIMIEPDNPLPNGSNDTVHAWTLDSLRVYLDTRLDALKELKQHDLKSFHERIDVLEKGLSQRISVDQTILHEVDRRLQERLEQSVIAIKERFDLNKEAVREALKNIHEDAHQAHMALKDSMQLGFRSVDDRLKLTKEFNEQITRAATESLTIALAASTEAVDKSEKSVEKRFDCVAADTPILCADLIWRAAGDLVVGDRLIGLDETSASRRGRRLRPAVVTANALAEDWLFEVTTNHGSVRCNANHPWLALPPPQDRRGRGGTHWRWVKTSDLKVTDQVMRPADLWTSDTSWESGWLAGMYDGEGCLSFAKQSSQSVPNAVGSDTSYLGVHLTMSQREGSTAERIKAALYKLVGTHCIHRREAVTRSDGKGYRQPFYHFIVTRRTDVMRILGSIRPPRLLIKSAGVWDGRPINGNHRETFVTSIAPVGMGTIANLSTTTRTYIAGGFAMHNSVNEFRQSLTDLSNRMIQRTEVDTMIKSVTDKIDSITSRMDRIQGAQTKGESSMSSLVSIGAVVIALIVGIVSIMTFVRSDHPAAAPPDPVRNFYLTPPPSGQIQPGK